MTERISQAERDFIQNTSEYQLGASSGKITIMETDGFRLKQMDSDKFI